MTRALLLAAALVLAFAVGWYARGTAAPPRVMAAAQPLAPPVAPTATAPDPRVEAFVQALAARDHDRALEFYEDLADSGAEPAATERLRGHMFRAVRATGGAAGVEDAVAFLEAFVWLYPRDVGALTVLAQGRERLGRIREALDAWWQVAEAAGGGVDAERALRRARLLADGLADGARTRGDQVALMRIYRLVLERDPGAHRFRVLLADALDADGDPASALEALDAIPVGTLDDDRLARFRARIEESAALRADYPQGLPLRVHGDHFVVEVGTANGLLLDLLLDTGATLTVLKPGAVARLPDAVAEDRSVQLGTAGGIVTAPLFRVGILRLGPVALTDARIAVMKLDGLDDIDGLLGMDQLSRFDFRIDPSAGRLRLAHRRD